MNEKVFELLAALNNFGYVELKDNDVKFNKKKISKKLREIGTIVLHEFIYNTFAKEDRLVENLAIRSVCVTPEEFRKFTITRDVDSLGENIKFEYLERYALIGIFYNINVPEYKDGFYYFTPNASGMVHNFKELIKLEKLGVTQNIKMHILN